MTSLAKKSSQEQDIAFPNPPKEISSISVNGSEQANTTMVIATSWDNSVSTHGSNLVVNIRFNFFYGHKCR